MDHLTEEFLIETSETLAELEPKLARLAKAKDPARVLSDLLRFVHTVGATSDMAGFARLGMLSHVGEAFIRSLHADPSALDANVVELLNVYLQRIGAIIAGMEDNDGVEPEGDDAGLIKRLNAMGHTPAEAVFPKDNSVFSLDIAEEVREPVEEIYTSAEPKAPASPALGKSLSDLVASLGPKKEAPVELPKEVASPAPAARAHTGTVQNSMSLTHEQLDDLVAHLGGLISSHNRLEHLLEKHKNTDINSVLSSAQNHVGAIKKTVLQARTSPVGNAWSLFPRLIKDLCTQLGKDIDFAFSGEQTRIDRQLLLQLEKPLLVVLQEICRYSIEFPDRRLEKGKEPAGTIRLHASSDADHAIIEITDDGSGLHALDNEDSLRAVQEEIGAFGGTIQFRQAGKSGGSFIRIRVPQNKVIVSVLVLDQAGEKYGVFATHILELIKLQPEHRNDISVIQGRQVFKWKDKLLPLKSLQQLIDPSLTIDDPLNQASYLLIAKVGGCEFALGVEKVCNIEEVYVKEVKSRIIAGSARISDGSDMDILDMYQISQHTGLLDFTTAQSAGTGPDAVQVSDHYLVFCLDDELPKALPVETVMEVIEMDVEEITLVDDQPSLLHDGEYVPLISLKPQLNLPSAGTLHVAVIQSMGGTAGLVVHRFKDIVPAHGAISMPSSTRYIAGSALIDDEMVEVVDVYALIRHTQSQNIFVLDERYEIHA